MSEHTHHPPEQETPLPAPESLEQGNPAPEQTPPEQSNPAPEQTPPEQGNPTPEQTPPEQVNPTPEQSPPEPEKSASPGRGESASTPRAAEIQWPPEADRKGTGLLLPALLGALAAVIVIAGFYLFLCSRPQEGVLMHHTFINDVDLSGMTVEEAQQALQEQFRSTYSGAAAQVRLAGETYSVSLWDPDILALDVSDALNRAMEQGHGPFLTRGRDWLAALSETHEAQVLPTIQGGAALDKAIAATGIGEVNTAVEHQCEVGENAIRIVKGGPGVSADLPALSVAILSAFRSDPAAVQYPLDCPAVEESIQPLDLKAIYDELYQPVADATVDPEQDYAIVPAQVGVSFDLSDAQQRFEQAEKGTELTIEVIYTQPEITTEFLQEHLFADALGSYATSVSGSEGRRKNVRLAADRCNLILMPGEQFSYNQTVGKRTEAKGFSEAGAYVNGDLVMEVGGGVCQTSSTLYMACVMSNLQIDQRHNHTYPSSYIGLGLDATVSWGGPDFKFTNNTDFPIKITSRYSSGVLSFTIYGTKLEDFTVEVESKVLSGSGRSRTYRSTASDTNGGQSIGYTGEAAHVQTYRNLYDGSGHLISSTKEAYSVYKTHKDD